jgi:hypothetical protein
MEEQGELYQELPQRPEPIPDQRPGHNSRVVMSESIKEDYRRPRQQQLKEYDVRIKFLSIGMVISIGCKEIPFTSVEQGMEELNAYVKNPHEERKRWDAILDQ